MLVSLWLQGLMQWLQGREDSRYSAADLERMEVGGNRPMDLERAGGLSHAASVRLRRSPEMSRASCTPPTRRSARSISVARQVE